MSCLLELEPLDPSLQSSFKISHLISPNCLHLFPTVMTVGVGPWVCTLPCGSAQLNPSCPIWLVSPNLMFPWPVVQCTAHVRCMCARCLGALPMCAAWVPPMRAAWALPMHATWALCLGALPGRAANGRCLCALHGRCAYARGLGAACVRDLWALLVHAACVRGLWALPVHAAWAFSTKSWHCAHDHQPMCAGIECPMPQISFCNLHCKTTSF